MVDKTTTVRHAKLGEKLGSLSNEDMIRLERAIAVFLGIAR